MSDEFQVGSLVKSTAGRDENKTYLIVKLLKNDFCELVDGNTKTFEKPKKKNKKHLSAVGVKIETVAKKLNDNLKVYDAEVYSAIKKFMESEEKT